MTDKQKIVEDLAEALVRVWMDNYTLSGAQAFTENEAKREAIVNEAISFDAYEAVYSRANDIMRGD